MTCARIINRLNRLYQQVTYENKEMVITNIPAVLAIALMLATESSPDSYRPFIPFLFFLIPNNRPLAQPLERVNQENLQELPVFNIDDLSEEKKNEATETPFPAKNEKQLLAAGFPLELVPDEFLCDITAQVMDNPVIIPTSSVTVKKHWENFELEKSRSHGVQKNPYDPSKDLNSIQLDPDLKARIDMFISYVVTACEAAKKMQTLLTLDDYKKITSAALELSVITSHNSPSVSFQEKYKKMI